MKEKISIIVPIYNVEKYLEECVESLIHQTYKNIEIILVDDESTDLSGKIADNYLKVDNRIKVYHKKNGGLSDARNYGINKATGRFISFVDSDDIVEPDFILTLYENLKKNMVRISACGICRYYDNGTRIEYNYQNIEKKYSKEEAHKYLNILGYFNVSSCNKLFDIKLFKNIKFPLRKKSEDMYVMYRLIEEANGIYYSSKTKYLYRQREGSITNNNNINYDSIYAAEEAISFYKEQKMNKIIPYAIQSYIFVNMGVYNNLLIRKKDSIEKNKIRTNVKKYRNEIIYSDLTTLRKIQLFLFIHNINLYNLLITQYLNKKNKFKK